MAVAVGAVLLLLVVVVVVSLLEEVFVEAQLLLQVLDEIDVGGGGVGWGLELKSRLGGRLRRKGRLSRYLPRRGYWFS